MVTFGLTFFAGSGEAPCKWMVSYGCAETGDPAPDVLAQFKAAQTAVHSGYKE